MFSVFVAHALLTSLETSSAMEGAAPQLREKVVDPNSELVRDLFATFLEDHYADDGVTHDYLEQIENMKAAQKTSLYVDFAHVRAYNNALGDHIEAEFVKYEPYLKAAVYNVVFRHHEDYVREKAGGQLREFWVHFYNLPVVLKLRELRSNRIGNLASFCGTVTRTTEVHPELLLGAFYCLDCQAKISAVEQHFRFTQPERCSNGACENIRRWRLDVENSKFVDWQKVRVQENANEIPSGSMPRHMDVILRQDAVEKAKAGDKVVFIGTLIVVPDLSAAKLPGGVTTLDRQADQAQREGEGISGLKDQGVRPLTFKMAFLATTVRPLSSQLGVVNIREDDELLAQGGGSNGTGTLSDEDVAQEQEQVLAGFSESEKEALVQMRLEPNIYRKLARSIAPAIFGHEEVKKGILLMLFGGVHKRTPEGISLRGDINVCVVGDPSVAKSQFLKYVTQLVPRAVYTSGKASSAAGLTATVVKDPETAEYNIEAGALMLADSGICCIDEFDKMDPADQVAIHEAMEQQTISISKAGIHATLNARTSILAAANPIGGRYDKARSLKANLTITPAIMSRFDLLFVVQDKNEPKSDISIATHIVSVHQRRDSALNPDYSQAQIQRYIRFARTIKPVFTPAARKRVIHEYCNLRMSDQGTGKTAWRITVRQLESMIRLSEAIARVHMEPIITESFVEEAARLLKQSIIHVYSEDVELDDFLRPPPSKLDILRKKPRENDDTDDETEFGQEDDENGRNAGQLFSERDSVGQTDTFGSSIDQDEDEDTIRERARAELKHIYSATADSEASKASQDVPSTQDEQATQEKPPTTKRKTTLSREQFERIRGMLLLHLHRQRESDPDNPAIRQSELLKWFLEEDADRYQGREDPKQYRNIAAAIISKMITAERSIIVIEDPGSADQRLLAISEEHEIDL